MVFVKVLGDLIAIHSGYLLAFLIRFGFDIPFYNLKSYLILAPWLTIVAIVLFQAYDLISDRIKKWMEIFSSLVCIVGILFLVGMGTSYLMQTYSFPRSIFIISTLTQLAMLTLWRRILWLWFLKKESPFTLIIAGKPEKMEERVKHLSNYSSGFFKVLDKISEDISPEEFSEKLNRLKPKGILICASMPEIKRKWMIKEAITKGVEVYIIPRLEDILIAYSSPEYLNGIPTFRISPFDKFNIRGVKRIIDIVLSIVFLIISLPVLVLAMIAIKIESPKDPVLYIQERIGRGGKIFKLIKLRTMIPDAEKQTGAVLASPEDPRVTKVGRILRRLRIDELPQLFNVLKGDMSLVGPRPERPIFVETFEKEIEGYKLRHILPVGLTGLAQIEGSYSTSPEDKLRYDLVYGKSASTITDLFIILRTLSILILKDKSE